MWCVIIVKWLLSKCVVAAELILHVWIVGMELRASELQIVCSFRLSLPKNSRLRY